MLTDAWHPLNPHEAQAALWRSTNRFNLITAGRGAGKTDISLRKLVIQTAVQKPWPDPRYFYAAPTREQAKRIAWNRLKALMPPAWQSGEPSEVELTIKTIWGSYIQVVGLDKPHRIEGVQWDGGVVDENSDIKPRSFSKSIYPALTWRQGWCWRQGVPKRQGIGAVEFRRDFEAAKRGALKDTGAFTWTSEEILPPEAIADAKSTLDPKTYREQFKALWETASGRIFHEFDRERNVRACSYHEGLPISVSCDFNVDPMAWTLSHDYKGRVEVFDEIWIRDANTSLAMDILWDRYQQHRGGWTFYGDATGRARKTSADRSDYQIIIMDERFDRYGHKGVHWPQANPSRHDRFASTNAMLNNAAGDRRIHIDPRCENLIDDLENRTYKEGQREPDDHDDIGHITDALGYQIYFEYPIGWNVTIPGEARIQHVPIH